MPNNAKFAKDFDRATAILEESSAIGEVFLIAINPSGDKIGCKIKGQNVNLLAGVSQGLVSMAEGADPMRPSKAHQAFIDVLQLYGKNNLAHNANKRKNRRKAFDESLLDDMSPEAIEIITKVLSRARRNDDDDDDDDDDEEDE